MSGGRLPLPRTGSVAFSVIIAMGAVTGVVSYMIFSKAAPGPLFPSSELPPFNGVPAGTIEKSGNEVGTTSITGAEPRSEAGSTGQNKTTAIPANAVTIKILQGASVQGNPAYDPETGQANIDKTIAWKNEDSTAHTATAQDKSFDSSIIDPGDSYTVDAKKIGAGEHPYACTIHPYMKGMIVIK